MLNHVEAFKNYLVQEEGRSPATAREYGGDVRMFRAWLDAESVKGAGQYLLEWETISAAHIRAFLAAHTLAPRRSHRFLASLRKFWTFLGEVQKLGVQNPPSEIKRPKLPSRLPIYLELPEIARLLDAAHQSRSVSQGLRDWALLSFLYGTGLRLSECLNLTFSSVSYQDGLPHAVTVIGKGNKERRVVLSPTGQRALHQWLKYRKMEGDPSSVWIWSFVTGQSRGERFSTQAVQAMIKRVAARAGLDAGKLTPHKLRHSYASALMNAGRGLDEVKQLLGHESIATTQIYVHVNEKRLSEAAASLPDVVGLGDSSRDGGRPERSSGQKAKSSGKTAKKKPVAKKKK